MVTDSPRPASAGELRWLQDELAAWQSRGVLDAGQVATISGGYRTVAATRHFSLGRLMLALGSTFVGVGLIWLVAANLDQLSPLTRFGVVAGFWLLFLVGGEVLAARGGSTPVVGALRLLAVLVLGATIFQAAQSLQVPAYEPALLGWWAAGAFVLAYAVRSLPALLVAVPVGVTWFVWQVLDTRGSALAGILAVGLLAVGCVALAALHDRWTPHFATTWRFVGVVGCLATLFAAALPFVTTEDFSWDVTLVAGLVAVVLLVGAAVVRAEGRARLEPLGAAGVLAVSALLVAWEAGRSATAVGAEDWLHALVSVGVYVLVAVGVAALGILRESAFLTVAATGALVVFTTVQSFAVFAQIIQGAWLFVVLGAIFLGTGVLFDHARRELAATLDDTPPTGGPTRGAAR